MVETIPMTDDDIAWLSAYAKEVQDTLATEFGAAEVRFPHWRRPLAGFTEAVDHVLKDGRVSPETHTQITGVTKGVTAIFELALCL